MTQGLGRFFEFKATVMRYLFLCLAFVLLCAPLESKAVDCDVTGELKLTSQEAVNTFTAKGIRAVPRASQ